MTLSFNIHYKDKFHPKVIELQGYAGDIPQPGTIVMFEGAERKVLEEMRLPHGSWRVKQLAYDIDGGKNTLVTATLELRSEDRKRKTQDNTLSDANI